MKCTSKQSSCWWKETSLFRCITTNKWRSNDRRRRSPFFHLWWSSMSDKTTRWKADGELCDGWIGITISETPLINSNSIESENQTVYTQHQPRNILAPKSQYVYNQVIRLTMSQGRLQMEENIKWHHVDAISKI